MGKHLHWKIKYHYVIKYLNENINLKSLSLDLYKLNMINIDLVNTPIEQPLKHWIYKYKKFGIDGLKTLSGRKLKKEINYEKMTKEELIEYHKLRDKLDAEIRKWNKKTKFAFINEWNKKEDSSISLLCIIMRISKSGYYYWLNNNDVSISKIDIKLENEIKRLYLEFKGVYGYRHIFDELSFLRWDMCEKTVYKYMRKLNLRSILKKKIKRPRESKNVNSHVNNLINDNFKANEPNKKWYTDITYVPTKYGYLFASIVLDGFNNEWKDIQIWNHQEKEIILTNLKESIKNIDTSNLIIHSDHGSIYSSKDFINLCKKHNIKRSMSKVGYSLGNRPSEYSNHIFKNEDLIHIPIKETTLENLNNEIHKIMNHYNKIRRQRCLNKMTPIEYKNNYNLNHSVQF